MLFLPFTQNISCCKWCTMYILKTNLQEFCFSRIFVKTSTRYLKSTDQTGSEEEVKKRKKKKSLPIEWQCHTNAQSAQELYTCTLQYSCQKNGVTNQNRRMRFKALCWPNTRTVSFERLVICLAFYLLDYLNTSKVLTFGEGGGGGGAGRDVHASCRLCLNVDLNVAFVRIKLFPVLTDEVNQQRILSCQMLLSFQSYDISNDGTLT